MGNGKILLRIKNKITCSLANVRSFLRFLTFKAPDRADGRIRVVFLCQYIPAWNKLEPVYGKMQEDPRFEPILLCVPSGIHNHILDHPEDLSNDTYEYYVKNGYPAVNAYIGVNQWVDLAALKPDYVFYSRPYNSFMPRVYSSQQVCRYTRICQIMYAFTITKEVLSTMLNPDFFRDCYCYFADNPDAAVLNWRNFSLTHKLGLQNTCYFGMTVLQQIYEARDLPSPAWSFSRNDFRIMWTPRWTTDPALGGSNFFLYKDLLLEYAEKNPQVDLLLRPHPLMFENFLKTGELTQEAADAYRNRVAKLSNAAFDAEKEYAATFWNSSVLVSDVSGILPEYFATGKPLIYCASNMHLETIDMINQMLEGCYIVNTPEELFARLSLLEKGEDPLREKRQALIHSLFGNEWHTTAEKIAQALVEFAK